MKLTVFVLLSLFTFCQLAAQVVPDEYVACYQVCFDENSLAKEFQHNGSKQFFNCKDYREMSIETVITDAVVNGDVRAFDSRAFKEDYPAVYSVLYTRIKDVKKRMHYTIDTVWMGDPADSVTLYSINKEVDMTELKSAVCIEKWNFDKKKLIFTKDVLALKPIRHHFDPADIEKKNLWLSHVYGLDMTRYGSLEEVDESVLVRSKTVSFEYLLEDPASTEADKSSTRNLLYYNSMKLKPSNSLFFSESERKEFVESMVELASKGKKTVYDYYTGKTMTSSVATANVAKGDVKSLVFIEDWYIDTETFYVVKKVLAVAPVVHTSDGKREVAFVFYFDEKRRQGLEMAKFFPR